MYRTMFRLICIIAVLMVVTASVSANPRIASPNAVLIDVQTGDVLFERLADVPAFPASVTKIVTVLTVLERYEGSLDDIVTVSANAAAQQGSTAWLQAGQTVPLRTLLVATMLMSGNDAAVAVAEHVAGSVEAFSELMMEVAAEAGATQSRFRNPHGLPDPEHVTTAHDMALITRYAYLRHEFFRELAATRSFDFPWLNGISYSHNRFLSRMATADGVKTGYTQASRHTLVGSITVGDDRLVGVIFGGNSADDVATEMVSLMQYGQARLAAGYHVEVGQTFAQVPVLDGASESVAAVAASHVRRVPGDERIRTIVEIHEPLIAPVTEGAPVATLHLYVGDDGYYPIPLVAQESVAYVAPRLGTFGSRIAGGLARVGVWGLVGFVALAMLRSAERRRRARRRRRSYQSLY